MTQLHEIEHLLELPRLSGATPRTCTVNSYAKHFDRNWDLRYPHGAWLCADLEVTGTGFRRETWEPRTFHERQLRSCTEGERVTSGASPGWPCLPTRQWPPLSTLSDL